MTEISSEHHEAYGAMVAHAEVRNEKFSFSEKEKKILDFVNNMDSVTYMDHVLVAGYIEDAANTIIKSKLYEAFRDQIEVGSDLDIYLKQDCSYRPLDEDVLDDVIRSIDRIT